MWSAKIMRRISTQKELFVLIFAAVILYGGFLGGFLLYVNHKNSSINSGIDFNKLSDPITPKPVGTENLQEKILCFDKIPEGHPGGPLASFSIQKDPQYCWEQSYPQGWHYEKLFDALNQFTSPDGNLVVTIESMPGGRGYEGSCIEYSEAEVLGYRARQSLLWDPGEYIFDKDEKEIKEICDKAKTTATRFAVLYVFDANEIQYYQSDGTFSTYPITYAISFAFKNASITDYQSVVASFLKGFRFVGN
jgi:hypothetical protein